MFSPFHLPLGMFGVGGPRNWFGTGELGDVRITAGGGAEASQDGGSTWVTLTGWTRSGDVVMVPSVEDGDMVVLHCRSLTIEAGMTLTTSHRCRGLVVYTQRDAVISGSLTLTARGCHANPADSGVTADTPVAPTDGHAVPESGITIRRLARGQSGIDLSTTLMHGCGLAAVASEANQPVVDGNGVVIQIPRVGGAGAPSPAPQAYTDGVTGGSGFHAPGGGGSGAVNQASAGCGGTATCWSGGPGSGGTHQSAGDGPDADDYGGPGAAAVGVYAAGGGGGNPGGAGANGGMPGASGTGGLLLLVIGGGLTTGGEAVISADGAAGGAATSGAGIGGAGSGGGVVAILYAGALIHAGTVRADGGPGGAGAYADGGDGGAGAVIGPIKIDPK